MHPYDLPTHLRYTLEHEWVRVDDDPSSPADDGAAAAVRVGMTSYAQAQLGDIVHVSLPEVGGHVDAGSAVGEVESTISISDLYAPVSGVVRSLNATLVGSPELVNADPYGEGWLWEVVPDAPLEQGALMDSEAYRGWISERLRPGA
jgi:glycine cleavage system H protein